MSGGHFDYMDWDGYLDRLKLSILDEEINLHSSAVNRVKIAIYLFEIMKLMFKDLDYLYSYDISEDSFNPRFDLCMEELQEQIEAWKVIKMLEGK